MLCFLSELLCLPFKQKLIFKPAILLRERSQKLVGGGGELIRNYLLSKQFGGPLLAALNICREPLSVYLNFETPPTYLSVLISSVPLLACENSYVSVNVYIMDSNKCFFTFPGVSNTYSQSLLLLRKRY